MIRIRNFFKFYGVGIILGFTFLVLGFLTISDYGLNIDEPIHFIRGQAYLKLLTTGKDKYSQADLNAKRVSTYKIQSYNGAYFLDNDGGHPPLNGILAAVFNVIFYEKLGIVGDLQGYHLFEIFTSSFLVLLMYMFVRRRYGIFAGIVSSLAMGLYPLFWGEAHYNIKDPIEATFFAFTIFFFYLSLEKKKAVYIFLTGLFCGFALATKFNIVFLPFIVIPYVMVRYFPFYAQINPSNLRKIPLTIYIALVSIPVTVVFVQLISRPYLWADPINRYLHTIKYYQDIGTGSSFQPSFDYHGFNVYAPEFIAISTPLMILFFFSVGILASIFYFKKEKDKFSFLFLLWFTIPVVRVMWPGSSIYSGVRQIMEYVPAMAGLSGIGAYFIRDLISRKLPKVKNIASCIMILSFLPLLIILIKMHPNENVYINSLIGGLKGAVDRSIPGAAETMGNAYLQDIQWLNKNAPKGSHYHLPVGLASNLPVQFVRSDMILGNFFSGIGRKGEYMVEMISVDFPPPVYNYRYLTTFINPVYEVKVDGAIVGEVWKNDVAHVKKGYLNEEQEVVTKVTGGQSTGSLKIELANPTYATRIEIEHDSKNCVAESSGTVSYSLDSSGDFLSPDDLYRTQGIYATSLNTPTKFVYLFTAPPLRSIIITPEDMNICLFEYSSIKVFGLKDIKPSQ
jgi:hypothetical protein